MSLHLILLVIIPTIFCTNFKVYNPDPVVSCIICKQDDNGYRTVTAVVYDMTIEACFLSLTMAAVCAYSI